MNAMFTGPVTNRKSVTVFDANLTFNTYTEYGSYDAVILDDSAKSTFNDLSVQSTGHLKGGDQDRFIIRNNFINRSLQSHLWDTDLAGLTFMSGADKAHDLYLPGADRGKSGYTNNFSWGILDLTSQTLNLRDGNAHAGGALYVGEILGVVFSGTQVTNIWGNNLNIYYDPLLESNKYLGGKTFDLLHGGDLLPGSVVASLFTSTKVDPVLFAGADPIPSPAPIPPSALLFISVLIGLWAIRSRRLV